MTLMLPARFSWVTRRYIESTRFREETGLSPEDYLERRRKASTTKQLAKDLSEGLGQPERKTEELKKLRAAAPCVGCIRCGFLQNCVSHDHLARVLKCSSDR